MHWLVGRFRCAAGERRCVGPLGHTTLSPRRAARSPVCSEAGQCVGGGRANSIECRRSCRLEWRRCRRGSTWRAPTHRWPARPQATPSKGRVRVTVRLRWCRQRGGAGSVRAGVAAWPWVLALGGVPRGVLISSTSLHHTSAALLRSKPILPLPRALSSFLHPCEPIPNTTLEGISLPSHYRFLLGFQETHDTWFLLSIFLIRNQHF